MTDRPTFNLRLRPEDVDDPVYSLRLALKRLLRDYGLRCLSVQVVGSTSPSDQRCIRWMRKN
jgi:hypothetical protein